MTPIPASWGVATSNRAVTEIDMSSYQIKGTMGLQVNNTTKMFMLQCKL